MRKAALVASKYIGARVFEYKDNFLMGPKSAHERGEWLNAVCQASDAAEDDLAQLASLVGSKSILRASDANDEVKMVEDAPALEFDLEDELARAFQTNETAPAPVFEAAHSSLETLTRGNVMEEVRLEDEVAPVAAPKAGSLAERIIAADLEVQSSATEAAAQSQQVEEPVAPHQEADAADQMFDFNDMIAVELDRALAQEVAAEAEFQQAQEVAAEADYRRAQELAAEAEFQRAQELAAEAEFQRAQELAAEADLQAAQEAAAEVEIQQVEEEQSGPANDFFADNIFANDVSADDVSNDDVSAKDVPTDDTPPKDIPANDIETQLAKLMGFATRGASDSRPDHIEAEKNALNEVDDLATVVPPSPIPPAPMAAMEPWQEAEVVEEPPMPVPEAPLSEVPSAVPYTPVQMSDFEPVETDPPEPAPAIEEDDDDAPMPESAAGREHIDMVLGGAAALAAAASKSPTSGEPQKAEADLIPSVDDMIQRDSAAEAMAQGGADLRLRLDELDNAHTGDKRRSGRRAALAIVAVALLGGTAALGWNFIGGNDADTPTLMASTEPVKVKPKDAGGKVVPNQDQAVYQAVEVQGQDASKQARLTDKKEQPLSVGVSAGGQKSNARVARNQPASNSRLSIKPRSVRTVVVRPDGTIVSSTAPSDSAVVLETNSVKSPTLNLQNQVANESTNASNNQPAQPTESVSLTAPNKVKVTKVTTAALRATDSAIATPSGTDQTGNSAQQPRLGEAEPASEPLVDTFSTSQPAAPKPVEVAAVRPNPVQPSQAQSLPQVASPYAVQVSSQRSAAAAQQSYATLSRRYSGIIGGRGVDYRQVEVKGKTYYRVRIPAEDRAAANRICGQLKARGGDCFVTR